MLRVTLSLYLTISLTISDIWPVFRWKCTFFPTPVIQPEIWIYVPLGVNRWNFACPSFTHMANYSCKKFSPTTYPLTRLHPLLMDEQTDRQTTMPIAQPLLKHGRLKIRVITHIHYWCYKTEQHKKCKVILGKFLVLVEVIPTNDGVPLIFRVWQLIICRRGNRQHLLQTVREAEWLGLLK